MKNFSDLSEQELLALAITLEEEDSRIYDAFAHGLRGSYPDTAEIFMAMAEEENGHRHRLLNLFLNWYSPNAFPSKCDGLAFLASRERHPHSRSQSYSFN
jgi:rubrerythrin